jgi:hypothetical protein
MSIEYDLVLLSASLGLQLLALTELLSSWLGVRPLRSYYAPNAVYNR